MQREKLGQLLIARGQISEKDLAAALQVQSSVGGLLGQTLIRMGALSEADLLGALSEQLGLPLQEREAMPAPEAIHAFIAETRTSASWWIERQAVAWRTDELVICAAANPLDPVLNDLLEGASDVDVAYRLAPRALVSAALEDLRSHASVDVSGAPDAARLRELAQEAPVIDFVNGVFAEALQRGASDVHVEPFEDRFSVRMRIDGILHTVRTAPRTAFDAVSSRIKLLSAMDIGERRLPQDGRQAIRISGQDIDLRVSTLPTSWGESVVMRLLGKSNRLPELVELGLANDEASRLRNIVEQPNGILLITGPTGSGKTTTIYRLLTHLNDGERKIVTVEDPVELDLPGVMQVHVRSEIGLSFASALRSILRQDPDVIMVGEIRDPETARIAVQAALTGHMVISTLHTNSALASIGRLLDLEVEGYLLADVLRGLVAQRLVRKLCPHCSVPAPADRAETYEWACSPAVLARAHGAAADWREPHGCPRCNGTGFRGRLGLYEIAAMTPELGVHVRHHAGRQELLTAARRGGMLTMFEDALLKARHGRTSMSEVYRVIGPVDPELHALPGDEVAEDEAAAAVAAQ